MPASSTDQDRLGVLVQYTAGLNPQGVRQLIYQHGYNPRHLENLPGFLLHHLQNGGESAVDDVLGIHPDRHLLLETLPAAVPLTPAPAAAALAGFSAFEGSVASPSALALQLANLIKTQKAGLVDVLNRHGSALLYTDPARIITREAVRSLQVENPVLVQELGALTTSGALFSAAYSQARAQGQLAAAGSLVGEVDISLGPDNDAVALAKVKLALAIASIVALLLGVFLFLHLRNQGAGRQ